MSISDMPFQRARHKNIMTVLQVIARYMPDGAPDTKLRAVLAMYFSRKASDDYLRTLFEAGKVEFDNEKKVWTVV